MLPIALAVLAALTGCAKVQTQVQAPPSAASTGALSLEATAWWKGFGDPELDSLVERAVRGSLDLRQARARILQARADAGTASAARWPSVTATASVTRSQSSTNATTTPTVALPATTLYQAGFDATWEADLFGGLRRAQEAAQARLEASEEDLRDVRLTLLGDVATHYITLRSSQALLEIARRNAAAQAETSEVTEGRFRLGLTSYLDVAQAKAQAESTRSDIPELEASIQQSIHRLGLLLGEEPRALVAELSPVRPLPTIQGLLVPSLDSGLMARRPDLRRAERNLAAALAEVGAAKADLYPSFDLTLGLGLASLDSATFSASRSRTWSLVPGLTLPVFNRGRLKAAVARKEAVAEEKRAGFQASYHSALEDVENALAAFGAQQERRRSLAQGVEHSQEAVTLALERYRRGLTTFLEVLTAQTSLTSAQNSLAQCDAKVLTSLVTLYKSLGGGWKSV